MKRLAALVTLVTLAGVLAAVPAQAGPSHQQTASPATATGWTPPPIPWGACDNSFLNAAKGQCGLLTVPLDYSDPSRGTIQLAVSRVQHTVGPGSYQGVMLVNPGGPGGSGLVFAALGAFVPMGAGKAYDWVGFDPRGVGSSRPALSCDPNYFQGPRPPYQPAEGTQRAWLDRTATYAAACGRAGGDLLAHLRTTDTVKDMDSLRQALGAGQISFYGFSYGTYLGQVYATLYPDRVRRMVLDSNVDPDRVWYRGNLDQDVAFEVVLKEWFSWLARYDAVYHLGRTGRAVEDLWYATKDKLQHDPAGGVVGGDEWNDIFLTVGYSQSTWVGLGDVFAAWLQAPDPAALAAIYEGIAGVGDDNGYAVYAAVQCSDAPWPTSWARWRRDNTRIEEKAPFNTWANAWFNAPCRTWPVESGSPVHVDGDKAPPMLLVDETLDAATPYAGSLAVRELFPRSSLIALPGGTSHANSLSGNACLDDQIASYLSTGALPPRRPGERADATCAPVPQPVPAASPSGRVPTGRPSSAAGMIRRQLLLPLSR